MAKVKFGMMMTDARGKLGGQVFTKARNGATVRTKVTPTNPRSTAQSLVRSRLGAFSSQWSALLTQAQRDSWNSIVASFPKTNIFGDKYLPSGKNLFIGLNTNMASIGGAFLDDAPNPVDFPAWFFDAVTVAVGVGGINASIYPDPGADFYYVVEATAPSSAGISNFSGAYRQVAVYVADDSISATTLQTDYRAKFGSYTIGAKISFRISLVSNLSGQKSAPQIVSAIVVA